MEHQFLCNSETAVVQTKQGKVKGYLYDGISIFKGIPYAAAERFHAPRPAKPWEGVLDATSYGYVCPLLEMPKPNGELHVPHRYWLMSENCQNLNVWTPACDDAKRPVLVWLHGGGYEAGSAIEQTAYEGENMCRIGQVVVVSVNHRLNILGYFDLSPFGEEYANSGNAGGDDIIAALRWVKENIAAFGGDPGNVTVFGQSGGGAKVTTLLQTPAADGLYAKGINMSGVIGPLLADAEGSGEELAKAVMAELGVHDVKELERVPYSSLAAAYQKVRPALQQAGKYVGCTPHPNSFYLGTPDKHGFRPETAEIPLMVGTVYGEFNTFAPNTYDKHSMSREDGRREVRNVLGEEAAGLLLPLYEEAYPERHPADLLVLDTVFRQPTREYIRSRSALNQCTYSYFFDQDMMIDGGRAPWHCADIPFVFHNTELVPVTQVPGVTEKLEKQIFDSVIAFARTGDPDNPAIPHWPASAPEEEQTMVFSGHTCVKTNHDAGLLPLYIQHAVPILEKKMEEMMEDVQH